MTVQQFSTKCRQRGMCDEDSAKRYCEANGITEPTEEDFEKAYRYESNTVERGCSMWTERLDGSSGKHGAGRNGADNR